MIAETLRRAHPTRASLSAVHRNGRLVVEVEANAGLAEPLTDLEDRVGALEGTFEVVHDDDRVRVRAELPCVYAVADDTMLMREGIARLLDRRLQGHRQGCRRRRAAAPRRGAPARRRDHRHKMPPTHQRAPGAAQHDPRVVSRRPVCSCSRSTWTRATRCGYSITIPHGSATCSKNASRTWPCSPTPCGESVRASA